MSGEVTGCRATWLAVLPSFGRKCAGLPSAGPKSATGFMLASARTGRLVCQTEIHIGTDVCWNDGGNSSEMANGCVYDSNFPICLRAKRRPDDS